MPHRLPERPPLAGEQGVDRVEAGHVRGRQGAGVEPADAGEDPVLEDEQIERDERQPEDRHRHPDERDDADRLVDGRVAHHRRDDARA